MSKIRFYGTGWEGWLNTTPSPSDPKRLHGVIKVEDDRTPEAVWLYGVSCQGNPYRKSKNSFGFYILKEDIDLMLSSNLAMASLLPGMTIWWEGNAVADHGVPKEE